MTKQILIRAGSMKLLTKKSKPRNKKTSQNEEIINMKDKGLKLNTDFTCFTSRTPIKFTSVTPISIGRKLSSMHFETPEKSES